jgi:hypothetical protein
MFQTIHWECAKIAASVYYCQTCLATGILDRAAAVDQNEVRQKSILRDRAK